MISCKEDNSANSVTVCASCFFPFVSVQKYFIKQRGNCTFSETQCIWVSLRILWMLMAVGTKNLLYLSVKQRLWRHLWLKIIYRVVTVSWKRCSGWPNMLFILWRILHEYITQRSQCRTLWYPISYSGICQSHIIWKWNPPDDFLQIWPDYILMTWSKEKLTFNRNSSEGGL